MVRGIFLGGLTSGVIDLFLIVSRLPWFARRLLITGVLFGFGFLLAMNYIILPLSAAGWTRIV
jgi:hypothetical protein